jgi:hypothetical protein
MTNPLPLVRVGAEGGQTGTVEIQDLLFSTIGPTQGLIAVEWNMNTGAAGAASMWGENNLVALSASFSRLFDFV